jgi:hypothetical protein
MSFTLPSNSSTSSLVGTGTNRVSSQPSANQPSSRTMTPLTPPSGARASFDQASESAGLYSEPLIKTVESTDTMVIPPSITVTPPPSPPTHTCSDALIETIMQRLRPILNGTHSEVVLEGVDVTEDVYE